MKDFLDWSRLEVRRERIRNLPADWKPPTMEEMLRGMTSGLAAARQQAEEFLRSDRSKTWDYEALFKK